MQTCCAVARMLLRDDLCFTFHGLLTGEASGGATGKTGSADSSAWSGGIPCAGRKSDEAGFGDCGWWPVRVGIVSICWTCSGGRWVCRSLLMYESRELRPLASAEFLRRLLQHFALSAGMLVFSILLGLLGYWWFEGLGPVDGFLNSAMLLGGHGACHHASDDRRQTVCRMLCPVLGPVVHRYRRHHGHSGSPPSAASISLGGGR